MKILELSRVSKDFGRSRVLNDISFSMVEGDIFGIIGPNGAGKTTLLEVIAGLTPLTGGEISFCSRSIRDIKPHKRVGLGISRTFELAPAAAQVTVLENVMVGAFFGRFGKGKSEAAARRSATETLEFLNLYRENSWNWGDLSLVYRHLSYDMDSDKLIQNLEFSGPALGATFRF